MESGPTTVGFGGVVPVVVGVTAPPRGRVAGAMLELPPPTPLAAIPMTIATASTAAITALATRA